MRGLAYIDRELEFEALFESPERRFARTNPGGVIESADSLELNNYIVDNAKLRTEHLNGIERNVVNLAQRVLTDPTFALEIVGHASSSGTDGQNRSLAEQRARQAAQEFFSALRVALLTRGVPRPDAQAIVDKVRSRTHIRGVGTSDPAVPGASTAADLARNRRVQIFVTAQG
jgi:outer membrane protein OmpA-like peptidoglycan-associated protein